MRHNSVGWPGRLRLAVRTANLSGSAGVEISSPATAWDVAGILSEDLQLTLVEPQVGLSIRKLADAAGSAWNVEARGLDVGRLLDVQRDDHPLLDGGIADGRVDLRTSTDTLRFHVDMGTRGAFGRVGGCAADDPQPGDPTDLTLRFDGAWQRAESTVEIPEVHATLAGAALSGSIALRDLDTDPMVDLALGAQNLDFVRLLGASGLAVPESLEWRPAAAILAWPLSRCAFAGPDGFPGRDHPRANQVSEFIRSRHSAGWAAFADRRTAREAAVGARDQRRGVSASAR